jgi:hypothetical protein
MVRMSTINKNSHRIWKEIIYSNSGNLIVISVLQAGEAGITGKDLERRTGLSRMTICKQRDRLQNEGFISYQRKGRRAKYYPTKLAMSNYYYRTWVRYRELFQLLERRRIPVSSPFFNIEFPNYFDYKLESSLLGFALEVGILITNILVQHLSPNKVKKPKRTQNRDATIIANRLTEKSVSDIISPVKMLTILRQSLYRLGYRFSISTTKKSGGYSFYEMEPKNFGDVETALNKVFPEAAKELQAINFDHEEDRVKRRVEDAKNRREQQKCGHKFQTEITDKIESYRCSICKYKSIIDRDTIIGSKEVIQMLDSIRPPTDTCRNHRWKVYTEIMPIISFECQLCHKVAEIPIESEEKLDVIREEVETEDSLDLKSSVDVCKDIEMFFHHNSNRRLTEDHYIKYYKKHHFTRKIIDRRAFMNEAKTIYGILAQHGYIKPINSNRGRVYIRLENKIKSVTGKILLTVATV